MAAWTLEGCAGCDGGQTLIYFDGGQNIVEDGWSWRDAMMINSDERRLIRF